MENLESKKEPLVLNPENAFEFDVARGLKELIDDRDSFYHIEVRDNILSIRKEGYNTPALSSVEYDMSQLVKNEYIDQKKDAIRTAYSYTFSKVGDLIPRMTTLKSEMFADTHNGAKHAFYHDRTGEYPEYDIAAAIGFTNPDLFKDKENTGMHR